MAEKLKATKTITKHQIYVVRQSDYVYRSNSESNFHYKKMGLQDVISSYN